MSLPSSRSASAFGTSVLPPVICFITIPLQLCSHDQIRKGFINIAEDSPIRISSDEQVVLQPPTQEMGKVSYSNEETSAASRSPHEDVPEEEQKDPARAEGERRRDACFGIEPTVAEGAYMVDGDELSHIFDASASYAFDSLRSSPDSVMKRHDDYAFLEVTVNGENVLVRLAKLQTVAGTQYAQAVEEFLTEIASWAAIGTKTFSFFTPANDAWNDWFWRFDNMDWRQPFQELLEDCYGYNYLHLSADDVPIDYPRPPPPPPSR